MIIFSDSRDPNRVPKTPQKDPVLHVYKSKAYCGALQVKACHDKIQALWPLVSAVQRKWWAIQTAGPLGSGHGWVTVLRGPTYGCIGYRFCVRTCCWVTWSGSYTMIRQPQPLWNMSQGQRTSLRRDERANKGWKFLQSVPMRNAQTEAHLRRLLKKSSVNLTGLAVVCLAPNVRKIEKLLVLRAIVVTPDT